MKFKVRKEGNSLVVTIPVFITKSMKIEKGDMLDVDLEIDENKVKKMVVKKMEE